MRSQPSYFSPEGCWDWQSMAMSGPQLAVCSGCFLDLGPICYVSHGSGERDPVPGASCPMARGCPLQLLQVIS